jgi:4-hydroxythreonine-4-phosphate dehydrogenase
MTIRSAGLPTIALTMGDPAGIGPEIALRAATDPAVLRCCRPVLVGSRRLLERVASSLQLALPSAIHDVAVDGFDADAVVPGRIQASCGLASARYVLEAIDGCLDGRYAALATAPINKAALSAAGLPWPGHTEMLAEKCSGRRGGYASAGEVMLMYDRRIAVALVTCHQSLASVPASLSVAAIVRTGRLLAEALRRLRRHEPLLCLCGLNPHAGENGLFGDEEERFIIPAMAELRAAGIAVEGPLPPDTAFTAAKRKRFSGYVVMYHDQGLIPFKALAFDAGVNVTLGLPVVRTSVDHGTAFDLAWQGVASHGSLVEAVRLAVKLAKGRSRRTGI